MIGNPDPFYDEEERKDAYDDLQDALTGGWEDPHVIDGVCPIVQAQVTAMLKTPFITMKQMSTKKVQNVMVGDLFGCDEGEMQGATWKEIIAFDQQMQIDKKQKTTIW